MESAVANGTGCVALALALLAGSCKDPPASPDRAPSGEQAASRSNARSAELELVVRLVPGLEPREQVPLVVFLHGLGGSGAAVDALGLDKLPEKHRTHLIAPNGTLDRAGRRFWNAGAACCNFDHRPVDDVARLGRLVDEWSARPGVDPERVYVVGFSNGGFMAQRLACERGERLAAVASIAGALERAGPCAPAPKLAVLLVHGDADDIVRYEGGRVFDESALAPHLSAPDALREWGRRLGCKDAPKPGPELDLDARLAGPETETLGMRGCASGEAMLYTVRGGEHAVGPRRLLDEVWTFLLSHKKRD